MAFNLMRISGALDPANKARYQRAATLTGMDSATAVDATTVQVKMAKPSSAFFAGLAEFRNMLMPKDVVENVGFSNPSALSGTGPFVVQQLEDYKVAKFTRHPKFFAKNQPHFQRLEFQPTNDRAAQVSAFLAKQLAAIGGVRSTEKPVFDGQRKDAKFIEHSGLNWFHLRFNTKRQPWSDPRVRQAIALVIDREELAKARYGTMKWALTGPIVPGFPEALSADQLRPYPGFDPGRKAQDIAQAKTLLSQAGVSNLDAKILPADPMPTSEYFENAVRLKDQIEKALPNVKITVTPPADTAAFAQQQANGDFELISYTITTLPDQVLELISQYHTTGSRNYGKFTDPEADATLDKALITLDNTARSQIIKDFQDKFLKTWLPVAQFYVNPDARFVDPKYHLEDDEEQTGPWNPGGAGYGGQSLRFWYQA
jgi:peptide/nickel transport system substrate-binding protein